MRPRILVTGATGKTGSSVVQQLLEQGWPVRALVRSIDSRSEQLRRLGAETVVADLFDPGQLSAAMRGVGRAYFCPPIHPHMMHSAAAFSVAAQEAKLESIVGLSQWLASASHPSLSTRQHWLVDRLFSQLPGIGYTIVNPGFFASLPYLAVARYAAHLGIYPMPADGESRNAPPSDEDIARVVVAALIDPDKHAGRSYRPTGPRLVSVREVAGILGQVFGRKVRHVKLPPWMFYKAARMDGFAEYDLAMLRHYLHELDAGTFAFGGPTDDVLRLTGRDAESFEAIARRYAASPAMRRSAGQVLITLGAFLSVPMRRGVDPARLERRLQLPVPAAPLFDFENEQWKVEHTHSLRVALQA